LDLNLSLNLLCLWALLASTAKQQISRISNPISDLRYNEQHDHKTDKNEIHQSDTLRKSINESALLFNQVIISGRFDKLINLEQLPYLLDVPKVPCTKYLRVGKDKRPYRKMNKDG